MARCPSRSPRSRVAKLLLMSPGRKKPPQSTRGANEDVSPPTWRPPTLTHAACHALHEPGHPAPRAVEEPLLQRPVPQRAADGNLHPALLAREPLLLLLQHLLPAQRPPQPLGHPLPELLVPLLRTGRTHKG